MGEWVNGRRDYGDGWIGRAWTDEDGMWFDLDTAVRNASIGPRLRGTPADCDLMHACIVALRERPEALRALLERPAVPAGRTVRAAAAALVDGERWIIHGNSTMDYAAAMGVCDEIMDRHAGRPQRVVVDLLLPEEPPTVEGRVEVGS